MLEAAVKARSLGFNQILFLSDSRRSVQVTNKERAPSWQERTLMVDWTLAKSEWPKLSLCICTQDCAL